jgi:hypothetical protein
MKSPDLPSSRRRLKGLWLAREFPYPLDTGDRIYSAQLIRAVADAGADLTLVAIPFEGVSSLPPDWGVTCLPIKGGRVGTWRALASTMPLVAAVHATAAYRAQVKELAGQDWDFVVIDQYGMGWAIPYFTRSAGAKAPVIVHIAHDHEASVCRSLAKGFTGSWPRHLALRLNAIKAAFFERRIARSVDLLTAITDEDAATFAADAPATPSVVLTPGYAGALAPARTIDGQVPKHVLMVGSYKWVAKEENLRKFVAVADPVFARHGISLHIIGSMTSGMAEHVRATTTATVVHGFVDDLSSHFAQARIAAVPEDIGGGFKLKFLDYVFGRLPVATLEHAAAGLGSELKSAMLCSPDLETLVQQIVDAIGHDDLLNSLQVSALRVAQSRYSWADRGHAFINAVHRSAS